MTLLKDDELRMRYSKRALEYVKKEIGWWHVAQKHAQLYETLIEKEQLNRTAVARPDTIQG